MANQDDIALMAHLMRRAGFGASRDELEARAAKGYDATVEELLNPETQPPVDPYMLLRHQPAALLPGGQPPMGNVNYMYYLVNTKRPLEEKMALFWHSVFATGNSKVDNYDQLLEQIDLFRKRGMGNYRDLLLTIAKNPTMMFWLDNNQNHGTAVNENWGRELLELFSLGAGNYTEVDVREASRAFTGWTFETKLPRLPYGRFPWKFEYRPEDHDDGEKTFLGHKGNLNGEDIINIVVQQPACARFICRHLYNFFVADEPQVPAWPIEAPRDPAAIDAMCKAFINSKCEIKPVLRAMFKSDFFKNARYQHLKSPAEVVVGTLRLVGGYELPKPGYGELSMQPSYMGAGSAQPAVGRGLAYRQGVDQQRLVDVAHQLRRLADRQSRHAGRAGDHQPPEGAGHQDAGAIGGQLPRLARPGRGWRRHQEGADRPGEVVGRDPLGQRRRSPERRTACRRDAAAHRGDTRIPVRLNSRHATTTGGIDNVCNTGNAEGPGAGRAAAYRRQRLPQHRDPVQ